ncbi:MAG: DUF3604 domain-containing protein [Myxococcales bacterium]|nr:DUF3604 domain-containing protein [Myxococcales bacterium]
MGERTDGAGALGRRGRGRWARVVGVALLGAFAGCGSTGAAPDAGAPDGGTPERRCAAYDPLRQPFFGDTHVHTTLSLDANLQGTRLTPADAYRFAKGGEVGIQPYDARGRPLRTLQNDRPLDFAVVTDHAEFIATVSLCEDPTSVAYESHGCTLIRDEPDVAFALINANLAAAQGKAGYPDLCGPGAEACLTRGLEVWQGVQQAAADALDTSDACTFTSFIGYEWSGNPATANLHRNVIFRNTHVPAAPISYFDENYAEGLWRALGAQCLNAGTGCDALTIAHNSNLSDGLYFKWADPSGQPYGRSYAEARHDMEPLIEVYQHKGDSECLPGTPVSDELCGFEKLPYNSLGRAKLDIEDTVDPGAAPHPGDFIREALGEGMKHALELGVNPFEYGFIASTDTHIAAPGAVAEEGFPGHGGAGRSHRDALPAELTDTPFFSPGGLAVLWAEENSRDALFDAMRRREAYGTSGPRIVVRTFGGWDYPSSMCEAASFAAAGYEGGVPMGGKLSVPPSAGAAPRIAIAAQMDPGTATHPGVELQRAQVIKGWLDAAGAYHVKVYDVAGDAHDGATVDPKTCEPRGAGRKTLCTVWADPSFDPSQMAYYYVRVVQNPSCRWTTYQCLDAGVDCDAPDAVPEGFKACCDPRIERFIQERAWTSPIWYVP